MQVDPLGKLGQRGGLLPAAAGHKLGHVIPAGQPQRARELAVDGVLHYDIQHGAPLVHHGVELLLHLVRPVAAGEGTGDSGGGTGQDVAPGGRGDIQPSRPEQGHVSYDNLAAHRKPAGQGGGAHRALRLLQLLRQGSSPALTVHSIPTFKIVSP